MIYPYYPTQYPSLCVFLAILRFLIGFACICFTILNSYIPQEVWILVSAEYLILLTTKFEFLCITLLSFFRQILLLMWKGIEQWYCSPYQNCTINLYVILALMCRKSAFICLPMCNYKILFSDSGKLENEKIM